MSRCRADWASFIDADNETVVSQRTLRPIGLRQFMRNKNISQTVVNFLKSVSSIPEGDSIIACNTPPNEARTSFRR